MPNKNNYNKLLRTLLYILCITLVVLFFWGEFSGLSITKKISHEKFNAFFTSLGAILTATSIFFLYRQTKMLQEERKLSVQPDIIPKSITIACEDYTAQETPDKFFPLFKSESNSVFNRDVYIELHNVGLGTAKQITAIWVYNYADVETMVTKEYDIAKHYFTFDYKYIDFIKTEASVDLIIPYGYTALFGDKIFKPRPEYSKDVQILPTLELEIQYYNNYNDVERKKFILFPEKTRNMITLIFIPTRESHT